MAPYANKRFSIYFGLILLGILYWKQICYILEWSRIKLSELDYGGSRLKEHIRVLQVEPNCGIPYKCPKNSFPLFLSTASGADNRPRLCVSGQYVIKPPKRHQGKGINAATVDPKTFQVTSVRTFNISLKNHTSEISKWIDEIPNGDIIIFLISDETSTLAEKARDLLNGIGSGRVQNLQFRSHWYMITQKGTSGVTMYEKITYSNKQEWGDAIEFYGCIPRKIPKKLWTVDYPLKQDKKKVKFCKGKNEKQYRGFCQEPRFEKIRPAKLTNRSLLSSEVYATPIFLFASSDLEIFLSSLDNMIHQPGVDLSLVTVLYDSVSNDVPDLAEIYGVHSNNMKFANTFEERLNQARRISRDLHPGKEYLIVLDSGVIPSPDFLYFFSQLFPVFQKDLTVSAISGWSCNCYSHNGSLHMVYRVSGPPKYGALISTKSRESEFNEIFSPDVARLQGPEACHLPSLDANTIIDRPQDLSKDLYYQKLVMIQQLGRVLEEEDVLDSCSNSVVEEAINVVYVELKDSFLSRILQCLGILNNKYKEYNGVVRLSLEGKAVMVITSDSSFYKSRPLASEAASKE